MKQNALNGMDFNDKYFFKTKEKIVKKRKESQWTSCPGRKYKAVTNTLVLFLNLLFNS